MPSINRLLSIWTGLTNSESRQSFIREADIDTFANRIHNEGTDFYAHQLRGLRIDMLSGLETGQLSITSRFGLKKSSALPRFLHGAFANIFNKDGTLRHDLNVGAVACVNQLTAVFTKVEGDHTPESEEKVLANFVNTEKVMASTSLDLTRVIQHCYKARSTKGNTPVDRTLGNIVEEARSLMARVLDGVDPHEILPNHGSGVSACETPIWARYGTPRYVDKINAEWPMDSYYYSGPQGFCDNLQEFLGSEEYDPCARVLLVPKDCRGPRLISCEPRETMWIQQGVMKQLYETASAHNLTRGSVLFTDQSPNQLAARQGSLWWKPSPVLETATALVWGKYHDTLNSDYGTCMEKTKTYADHAYLDVNQEHHVGSCKALPLSTLDCTDASDMLRLDLVELIWPKEWFKCLNACRSAYTELPSGQLVEMRKHAPMGSACCFPVMAFTFWSLLTAILPQCMRKHVRVYGDDIVLPIFSTSAGIEVLEAVGFKINNSKSYSRGPYRESCGKEYVRGFDVSCARLHAQPHDNADSRMKLIAFANNLYECDLDEPTWLHGLLKEWYGVIPQTSAQSIFDALSNKVVKEAHFDELERRLYFYTHPQQVRTLTGVLLAAEPDNTLVPKRINRKTGLPEWRYLVGLPRRVAYPKHDWSQVLRALTKPRRTPFGVDVLAKDVRYAYRWRGL